MHGLLGISHRGAEQHSALSKTFSSALARLREHGSEEGGENTKPACREKNSMMSFSGQTQPLALHRMTVTVGLCVCTGSPQERNHWPSDSGEPPRCLWITDSGKCGSIAFSCIPTSDFRSPDGQFQSDVSKWPSLKSQGHKAKPKAMNLRKGVGVMGRGLITIRGRNMWEEM